MAETATKIGGSVRSTSGAISSKEQPMTTPYSKSEIERVATAIKEAIGTSGNYLVAHLTAERAAIAALEALATSAPNGEEGLVERIAALETQRDDMAAHILRLQGHEALTNHKPPNEAGETA